ncbi:ImmA/IrrE family metallo-endopeptidase [Paenibacillus sp. IHBB 10380]|uniref:ImmA/IrrE family metallo-endopeptidase n=1 Tax=Paenibacillus sp. IHBB 10380 TaxID=1566358 RepID=UPI0006977EAB|nr:ImmA/IrrE family metallo-endopeptidase [Paenibacillus sp. IHBB 10380]
MSYCHQITKTEQFVENLYEEIGITETHQLEIDELSKLLNIWVHYESVPSRAIESVKGLSTMFIDDRNNLVKQWLEFLHELCHLLRHAGNQTLMPKQFTDAQEREAERFVLYAAIPFSMLTRLTLPTCKSDAIAFVAHEFRVPLELAERRIEQFEHDNYQSKLMLENNSTCNDYSLTLDEDLNNDSLLGVRIRAYYDYDGDWSRPHTLVVEQPAGFDWDSQLSIQVDKNYKQCDIPPYIPNAAAPVLSEDIQVIHDKPGYVAINLPKIAWRHGRSIDQLFLSIDAIEDAQNF